MLIEKDIEDPIVYINLHDLKSYTIQHLKTWLIYRGDSLKNVEILKETQVKVLQYFKLGTEEKLIDPTPNKIWLKVVSATFLLVCFVCLNDSTREKRKYVFYFTSKALFVLEIIKF